MHAKRDQFDVAIGGGGSVGLALACALTDAFRGELRIAVFDRGRLAGAGDPRASALSVTSKRLLSVIGVWSAIADAAQPVTAIDITDSSLGDAVRPVLLSYDNRLAGDEPASYIVENDGLRQALIGAVAARPAIAVFEGSPVEDYAADTGGIELRLGQRRLRALLLIAADGRASRLREMAGIKILRWSYPQTGIVTTVSHAKPHFGRAVQHFLPSGPFAILPLRRDRSAITWSEDASKARELLALDNTAFAAELGRRFDYRLGAIETVGQRAAWPLDMQLARALIEDRLALVGDAAHVVHPIAGQGLNLGLRDVAALVEVVYDAARLGLDIGSALVLERYQRWRRLDSALSAATYDGLNRLFSSDSNLLRTARDFGLALVEQLPAVKQFFVAEAAGLTGEVPKLLRGELP
jgi:2-octaprenyl-6-methoxyphenol hydroxylase